MLGVIGVFKESRVEEINILLYVSESPSLIPSGQRRQLHAFYQILALGSPLVSLLSLRAWRLG